MMGFCWMGWWGNLTGRTMTLLVKIAPLHFLSVSCSLLCETQTSECSAYCVGSLEPAGERNHWASAGAAYEDLPQLGCLQDGCPGNFGSHRMKGPYHHPGTDAAASPCVNRMWYNPEISSATQIQAYNSDHVNRDMGRIAIIYTLNPVLC